MKKDGSHGSGSGRSGTSRREEPPELHVYDYSGEESSDASSFVPSVKLKRIDDGSVLITTVVLKESSLSSSLFQILEEERVDIVYENQYRTENKVSHTILVKFSPGFDVGGLQLRLYEWAGKEV